MTLGDGGFLVVEVHPAEDDCGTYQGVGRVPEYRHDAVGEYAKAMDFYTFDKNCKDPATNLIPSRAVADWLANWLAHSSEKPFEVIVCCPGPESPILRGARDRCAELGFDVVGLQGYWSIVEDFAVGPWAESFRTRLNDHGLFQESMDAEEYLKQYRDHGEADSDAPFEIVFVARCQRGSKTSTSPLA